MTARARLAALLALLACGCGAAPPVASPRAGDGLSSELRAVVEDPAYGSARWGLHVVDVASGEVLHALRSREKFRTGSTAKIFSVTAALDTLGPGHRFETPVLQNGTRRPDGVLEGDLVLRASGDLTLGGRTRRDGTVSITTFDHYDANVLPGVATLTPEDPLAGLDSLARQVHGAGVRRIEGDVVVDDRLWEPVELDGVPISPIVVNDNLVDFVLSPGATAGAPAAFDWRPKTAAYRPDVLVATAARGSRIAVTIAATSEGRLTVRGSIPLGASPVVQTFQVPDPAAFARTLFIEALARAGVEVAAEPLGANPRERLPAPERVARLPEVARLVSPPFSEYARLINKVSHNLGANLLPLLLAARSGKRTLREGMELERAFVRSAGLEPALFTLEDGQGLPGNAVAPLAQTQYLIWLASRSDFATFLASTPVLGVDGSLANVLPAGDPARGRVHAKTGTLVAVGEGGRLVLQTKALAGYIDSAKGRRLAFAIYLNDLPLRDVSDVFAANDTLGHLASLLYRAH